VIQFALLGLGAGGVFAMLAQGIVLIYRGSGTVNFAHGAMAMLGAFVFWDLRFDKNGAERWSFLPAFLAAVVVTAVLGALVHLVVMKPLGKRSPLVRVIASLALVMVVTAAAKLYWGNEAKHIPPKQSPLPVHKWLWGSIPAQSDRVLLLIIATAITLVLWFVFRFTRFGLAVVAAAEDERAASALGWSPDLLATVNWAAGGALAGVAGVLVAPLTGVDMDKGTLMVIAALAAALLAGFSNFWIALAGGIGIGVAQSLMTYFQAKGVSFLDRPGLGDALPFVVIIVVLVVRGRALPLRSHVLEKLPKLGSGRMPWWIVFLPAALALLSFTTFDLEWNTAFFTSYAMAITLLSVVVLTGFAGQISLAQFALAGLGALITGRVIADHQLSFEVALVIGIGATMLIGLLFALPALRTRGINLAVATLGLGLAVQTVIFSNGLYTGGMNGVPVGERHFLGVNIDRFSHPERYTVFTLLCLVFVSVVVLNLRRGRAGRRLIAVRTNERAAASLGVSVIGAKLYAFAVASAIAGLGGILYAFKDHTLTFENGFSAFDSINVVVLAVLGGVGYVLGAVMGSQLAVGGIAALISNRIGVSTNWIVLVGGLILLIQVVAVPDGMASHLSAAMEKPARRPHRVAAGLGVSGLLVALVMAIFPITVTTSSVLPADLAEGLPFNLRSAKLACGSVLNNYSVPTGGAWKNVTGALRTHLNADCSSAVDDRTLPLVIVVVLALAAFVVAFLLKRRPAAPAAEVAATALEDVAPIRVEPLELKVNNVSVRVGGIFAVYEASLEVHPGEVVGLIGPNGAGKTTFIDAVTGFVRTTQGEVLLGDKDVIQWPPARRKRSGISRTFQSLELFDDLTVRDNLLAGADDFKILPYFTDLFWPRKEALPPTALRAIKDLELEAVLDTPAGDLPYGQRRLVSIARALAGTPSILMLDEPAAGLSDSETAELRHLIRRLAEEWGIGVLLVEHDMSLVMAVCDRIVALETGSVIATGIPEEIARDPRVRAAYLGDETPVPDGEAEPSTSA
jgi:sulfate-transporting ATPase